jgi:hypothetical protein
MPTASARPVNPAQTAPTSAPTARARRTGKPFFGLIESVVVESPATYEFDGAVSREHGNAVWTWMTRDVAPDLIDADVIESDEARQALDALMQELLTRARKTIARRAITKPSAGSRPSSAARSSGAGCRSS